MPPGSIGMKLYKQAKPRGGCTARGSYQRGCLQPGSVPDRLPRTIRETYLCFRDSPPISRWVMKHSNSDPESQDSMRKKLRTPSYSFWYEYCVHKHKGWVVPGFTEIHQNGMQECLGATTPTATYFSKTQYSQCSSPPSEIVLDPIGELSTRLNGHLCGCN